MRYGTAWQHPPFALTPPLLRTALRQTALKVRDEGRRLHGGAFMAGKGFTPLLAPAPTLVSSADVQTHLREVPQQESVVCAVIGVRRNWSGPAAPSRCGVRESHCSPSPGTIWPLIIFYALLNISGSPTRTDSGADAVMLAATTLLGIGYAVYFAGVIRRQHANGRNTLPQEPEGRT